MTEEQRERYRKHRENMAIMAHSIAEQVVAMPGVSFQEAFETLALAKANIERSRDWARATVRPEILDEWGQVIEKPQAETEAQGKANN